MKSKCLKALCLSLLFSALPLQAAEATKSQGPFDASLSFGDLVDVEGSALYYGNVRLEYSKNKWVFQLDHNRNINQLEVENRIQGREKDIDIQSTSFTLKYKALSYIGPSVAIDYVDFTKSNATLWGVGGWIKYSINKSLRADFEAIYFVNDLNSEIDLDSSYFYKAALVLFVSDAFYTKLGLGYKSLDMTDTKKDVDFAIKSPLVDIGVGYIF